MRNPGGYGIKHDPAFAQPEEVDTVTCSHCNKIVRVPPGWKPENMPNKCKSCMGYVCLGCWQARMRGADCVTFFQRNFERSVAKRFALKSYGF